MGERVDGRITEGSIMRLNAADPPLSGPALALVATSGRPSPSRRAGPEAGRVPPFGGGATRVCRDSKDCGPPFHGQPAAAPNAMPRLFFSQQTGHRFPRLLRLLRRVQDDFGGGLLEQIAEILWQDPADFIQLAFREEILHHPQHMLGNGLGVDRARGHDLVSHAL